MVWEPIIEGRSCPEEKTYSRGRGVKPGSNLFGNYFFLTSLCCVSVGSDSLASDNRTPAAKRGGVSIKPVYFCACGNGGRKDEKKKAVTFRSNGGESGSDMFLSVPQRNALEAHT